MSAGPLLDTALEALGAGLCVLPPRQDGTKAPDATSWQQYQRRCSTEAEVRDWYADGRTGLGLVCGRVSGGLEMLELEGRAVAAGCLDRLLELADAAGLRELVDRIGAGYTERTPSGGIHWVYRVPTALGNTKLARRPATAVEREAGEKVAVLAETRGEGGYVIVAPSSGPVHPTGRPWALEAGGFATIAAITDDERDELWRLVRLLDEMPAPIAASPGQRTGDDRPGDRYNARSDIQAETIELLERHGWTLVWQNGARAGLRRPGKPAPGISATVGYAGPGVLHVFSTSTEFESERSHAPFAVYANLEHGGDFAAAARALEPGVTLHLGASADERENPSVNGRHGLAFRSAREIVTAAPVTVEYVTGPPLPTVPGTTTELDGKPKASGKTTLLLHAIAAVVDGRPFLGHPTRRGAVVLLTEQSAASIAPTLRALGLDRDELRVLTWPDAFGTPWPEIVAAAVEECERAGALLLAIDTLGQFTGLRGDAENDSGAAMEAMAPIQAAAASGLAVLVSRHDRKSGGDVGESGRGSNAWSGAVDCIVALRRPLNPARATIREIEGISRRGDMPAEPVLVELTDAGYVVLGSETAVAFGEAQAAITAALADREWHTERELVEAVAGEDKPEKHRTTTREALGVLVRGALVEKGSRARVTEPYPYRLAAVDESQPSTAPAVVDPLSSSSASVDTPIGVRQRTSQTDAPRLDGGPDDLAEPDLVAEAFRIFGDDLAYPPGEAMA